MIIMGASSSSKICIEIALAFPEEQHIARVKVPQGASPITAIKLSNIFDLFNEVPEDVRSLKYGIGIFSKEIKDPHNYSLKDGDRIEIYRPLLLDPKQTRLRRARSQREQGDAS